MFINLIDFGCFLTKFWESRPAHLAIYTVFDEESESDVENLGILHPDLEIKDFEI